MNIRRNSELALEIWRAGVAAVDSRSLVRSAIAWTREGLRVVDDFFPVHSLREIVVLGCGKAGAGMVTGLEEQLAEGPVPWRGWVQVPDDCVRETSRIRLFGARPAGFNFPTERGVEGARHVLDLARVCDPRDLCLMLISGGGSALLPAPRPPLTLPEKLSVTQTLSGAGADIRKLNTVRRELSDIKGGKLAAACRADRMITLVISDIQGDPLDLIASGPTVPTPEDPASALQIIQAYEAQGCSFPSSVHSILNAPTPVPPTLHRYPPMMRHPIIGHNATAVHAAAQRARDMGFMTQVLPPEPDGTLAEDVGVRLAQTLTQETQRLSGPICIVWGGEPTVTLCDAQHRGRGGRNQHVALSALDWFSQHPPLGGTCTVLSGGTDGEDGPTDAAGAWWDNRVLQEVRSKPLMTRPFLDRCDSYNFFEAFGTLLLTGPTHTNVGDLRVALWTPSAGVASVP